MAKRKPVPPEKQKYVPIHCALKAPLLACLKEMGANMGLQRTKVIDMIVAGIIREDIDFNQIFKNLSPEQIELRDSLWDGPFRTAYLSLHKSTVPGFKKLLKEKGWTKSMLMERLLMSYVLLPEGERFELKEPPKEDFVPLDAKTYEDLKADDTIHLPESPADEALEQEDIPEEFLDLPFLKTPPTGKKFVKKERPVRFIMKIEIGFTLFISDYAKKLGTTKTDLITCIIDEVCAKGLVFSGDASILNKEQKTLYQGLHSGGLNASSVMIEKESVQRFEKLQALTGWEKNLLLRRVFLTWLLAPWPAINKV